MANRPHSRMFLQALASTAFTIWFAAAPAHAQQTQTRPPMRTATVQPADGVSQSVLFQIVMAEIALQRGQLGAAWSTYMSVARDTKDARLARRAVEIAYADRVLDRAIESARLWNQIEPGQREVENTLVSLLVEGGRLAEAEPLIAARVGQADSKPAVIEEVQRLLARAPDRSAAFALLDRLARPHQDNAGVRLALARSAALAGHNERAAAEARAAMNIEPHSEHAVLIAAQLLVRKSPDEATRLLEDFIARNPKTVQARLALGRTLSARGQHAAAREALRQALTLDPSNLDALLAVGLVAAQARDFAQGKRDLQAYLDASAKQRDDERNINAALFTLAEMAEEQRRYDEANDWLDRVEPGAQFLAAQTRIARNLARVDRLQDARTLLQAIPARDVSEQQQLVAAEAQVLREARQYKAAFEVLEGGLKTWPDAPELLYDYALAAEKVERADVMEVTLRRVIALKPDDPHAYNALGYWLADRTQRLDEAETLIDKALSFAPDDAYIIDSMGWLQYRRGRHGRAIELLERAYGLKADPEIAAHLGEVYWAAGQRDKAEAVWRSARDRDPTNETLVQTLARYPVKF